MAVPSISPGAWPSGGGDSIWNGLLDSIAKGMQLGFMPAQNKADLQQKQLANALAQINLQTAPQMNQAKLALTQAQAADDPIKALGSYYGGMGRYNQAAWNSSPNSQMIRVLNSPQFQQLVASNPDVAKQVTTALGGIGVSAGSGYGANPPAPTGPLTLSPQDVQKLGAAGIGSFAPTSEDVANVQRAAGDAFIKKTQTANQINQRLYGTELDNLFSAGDELMPSVVKYSGLAGKYKGAKDQAAAALGDSSPEYQQYTQFTRGLAPLLANEMRRTLGGQATDYEGSLMKGIVNPAYWDSNPQQAMAQWNALRDTYKRRINPALASSPSQIQQGMQNGNPTTPQTNAPAQGGIARVRAPNGKTFTGTEAQIEAAIKAHPELKRIS